MLIAILAMTCDDPNDTSSSSSNSTLEDSQTGGNGDTGYIDDYFFDLDAGQTPYVNSKFYRYSGLSILEPLVFDPDSDTLNFSTIGDYVLSFTPQELVDSMVTVELLDELSLGEDVNGDGEMTGAEFNDLYRYEEINFSHSFTDVLKLEWDEDNERYLVVGVSAEESPLSYKYYIGDPDVLYDGLPPDTIDIYDSLVYITQINYNDLSGFSFVDSNDVNDNGLLDEGENWELDDSFTSQYYFDQNELVAADSVHSSQTAQISHTFNYEKKLLSIDSLVYKISTDCNDNGSWDDLETEDVGNGVWDPAEPFLNQGGADDVDYNIGEPFLDRNCNGNWDDAEEYVDVNENGLYDEGEPFTDTGNGQIDEAEICADGSSGCSFENLYTMSDRPNVLVANYSEDGFSWEVYEEINDEVLIRPRWSNSTYSIIETYPQVTVKTKAVPMVDRVETIYSYQFIENTYADQSDYSISKTVWYDNADRNTNYHLFRKDGATGNIKQLVHDSYFVLPSTTPGASIDGGSFEDYIVFDAFPTEQTYLYTYDGMLRDGEKHQSSRQTYSSQTNAIYNITETYEVYSDTLAIPELNSEYDLGEEFTDIGNAMWDEEEEYNDANESGAYDDGENFIDENGNGIWDGDEQYIDGNGNNSYDEGEDFTDIGNGIWDEGEEYVDQFTFVEDAFKIIRTKQSIMQGSGVELVEVNNIWLGKGYGIIKDEMQFRFNDPDDFDGFYRLELVDRHPNSGLFNRSTFNSSTEINFNEFNLINGSGDDYKKTRTYGLQKLEFDAE